MLRSSSFGWLVGIGISALLAPAVATAAVFPCTETGINDAVAAGGGPHTFSCGTSFDIETVATVVIDNDVILDGGGRAVSAVGWPFPFPEHRIFYVEPGVTAELRNMEIRGGLDFFSGAGILNEGILTVSDCSLYDNLVNNTTTISAVGGAIDNRGVLTVLRSTIRDNTVFHNVSSGLPPQAGGAGIYNGQNAFAEIVESTISGNEVDGLTALGAGVGNDQGTLIVVNSTVSGNLATHSTAAYGSGVMNAGGSLTLTHVTVSGNTAAGPSPNGSVSNGDLGTPATLTVANTLVDGDCALLSGTVTSLGGNLESPGDTCSFTAGSDQVSITGPDLALGPLQANGGPTETHALTGASLAFNAAEPASCEATDQRGVSRPAGVGCDVGAYEGIPVTIPAVGAMGLVALALLLLGSARRPC